MLCIDVYPQKASDILQSINHKNPQSTKSNFIAKCKILPKIAKNLPKKQVQCNSLYEICEWFFTNKHVNDFFWIITLNTLPTHLLVNIHGLLTE